MTMTKHQAAGLTSGRAWNSPAPFFRFWMPYCFQRVEHPRKKHVFIPLNRDYVPLGVLDRPTVDYPAEVERYGIAFNRDPAGFEGIWWNTDRSSRLWLYDDTSASRFGYFARLEALLVKGVDIAAEPSRRPTARTVPGQRESHAALVARANAALSLDAQNATSRQWSDLLAVALDMRDRLQAAPATPAISGAAEGCQ